MKNLISILSVLLFIFAPFISFSQIDHFETIVFETDIWTYKLADSEPPSNWMQSDFNDSSWESDNGGFGYGDDDDNTFVFNQNGIYLRKAFDIIDLQEIESLILDADYDDGFIAYLNGIEIARAFINGDPPTFNSSTYTDHEAVLYSGGVPERFIIDKEMLVEGTNTIAIQVANFGTESSDLSARFFLSAGINQTTNNYGAVPFWFDTYIPDEFISSNLPLFIINTNNQQINNDPRIVAQLGVINNGENNRNFLTDPFNEYDGRIEIETHGNSSQFFDKKNYRIETQTETGDNNNVSLLGMPEENDWVLHGPFSDKSLLRNVLSYYLGSKTEGWTPRTQFCELIIDGDYKGVYVLIEKIKRDKNRLDISKITPEDNEGDELTGGYVFRIDWDNDAAEADGWISENGDYPFNYGYVEPSYKDITDPQRNYLINYITQFENAMLSFDYKETYTDYIDVSSLVDYFLVNELAKHIDAFKLSFYMYKVKDSKGGKIHFGPLWDFNLGYGNYDYGCDNSPNGWIYPCTSVTTWLDRLVEIDAVQDQIYCRWNELRSGPYQTDQILRYIDDQAVLLDEAQARNFQRFPVLDQYLWPNSFIGNTYDAEVNFLKNFVLVRLQWMDQNIELMNLSNCSQLTTTQDIDIDFSVNSYPNPIVDQLSIEFSSATIDVAKLHIYSIDGRLKFKGDLQKNQNRLINTQDWKNGMYIYNIQKGDKILHFGSIIK